MPDNMSDIKQQYIDKYKDGEDAVRHFIADLMRGDEATFKQGYTRENAILAAQEVFGWERRDIDDAISDMTDNILTAEKAMGIEADTRINLLGHPKSPPHGPGQREYQRHVAIEWEGGVLWLNMFDFATGDYEGEAENRHFCIDVRQFNSAGKVKGEGVFTMARNHQRGAIRAEDERGESEMVSAHGWSGGFVVAILTDPDGEEKFTDDERS